MAAPNAMIIDNPAAIAACLQVGLEVIVQKDVGQEKQWATIVGWSPEQFLLLDGPATWAAAAQLFPQNRLLIRFISLGSFYGFDAKVLVLFKNPLLVVTEWPRQLERMPLSRENRYAVTLAVDRLAKQASGSGGSGPHRGEGADRSRRHQPAAIGRYKLWDACNQRADHRAAPCEGFHYHHGQTLGEARQYQRPRAGDLLAHATACVVDLQIHERADQHGAQAGDDQIQVSAQLHGRRAYTGCGS